MTLPSSRDKTKNLQQENEALRKQVKDLTIRYEKEKETSYKTKQLLNNAIKATLNAMFFVDAKTTKIIDCSPSASEMFGFDREEMIGNRIALLHVNASHRKAFDVQLQAGIAQKGFLSLTGFEMKRKNGRVFPTEHSIFPVRDRQGKIREFVGLVRDKTGIRWAENALRESRDRYQMLIETMTDGLGITDENNRIIYANDKAVEMLGYSHEELLGCSPLEFLDRANQKIMNEQQKNITGAERDSFELTWARKDGQKIHTILSPRDIFKENGTFKGTFAVITDITARKQAEEDLRESEEKYRSVVEFTDDYISIMDRNCVYRFLNKKFLSRRGLTLDQWVGRKYGESHDKKETKDFAEKVKQVFDAGKSVVDEHQSPIDGRFFLRTISPIKGSSGHVKLVTVIAKDIHDRVLAINKIRESETKFRTLFEEAMNPILVVDENGHYIDANKSALNFFECDREELHNKKAWDWVLSDQLTLQKQAFTSCTGKRKLETDYSIHRKIKSLLLNLVPLNTGNKVFLYGIGQDMTTHKNLERSLSKQTKELQFKSQTLEELNTALKVLLRKREEDSVDLQEKVLANVNQLIAPTMQKLKQNRLNKNQQVFMDILESNLAEIVSSFPKSLSAKYLLTATELQIANLLKQGKTSKEMARVLNLSPKTIHTHRRNIRKKLEISGKKTNLRAYLLNLQ